MSNKAFIVRFQNDYTPIYLMSDGVYTPCFNMAMIFDQSVSIWGIMEEYGLTEAKVCQADEKDIFKWQLKNEVPRDRL